MASNYEFPEEVNDKRLRSLGKEVEMKTFKTNVELERPKIESDQLLKIVCVGGYTGGFRTKGDFINDYLQVSPPVPRHRLPLIGVDFYLKRIKWQRNEGEKPIFIKLQIWEIAEQENYSNMCKIYLKDCLGALVLWGTCRSCSLTEAVLWREKVKEFCPSVPYVLVTDNVGKEPPEWIGAGNIFESELALDQFCKEHGFVDHFEIISHDWVSGEKSVFGQALNCLLEAIFQSEQEEEPGVVQTWM